MKFANSPSAAIFEKVLRAFETHGIAYSDVLARLRRLLANGAAPEELLAVLQRRESPERAAEYSRIEALLNEAAERAAARAAAAASNPGAAADRPPELTPMARAPAPSAAAGVESTSYPPADSPAAYPAAEPPDGEVTVDLDFQHAGRGGAAPTSMRASDLDLSVLAKRLRSLDERVPPRGAALEALTRSYERAREAEAAAAERASKLAEDLEAVRSALRAEQGKVREIERALAERDMTLDQTRQALDERDARIASLAGERTSLETAIESGTTAAAALEAELRAARARAESAASELRTTREAAAALDAELERSNARLKAVESQAAASPPWEAAPRVPTPPPAPAPRVTAVQPERARQPDTQHEPQPQEPPASAASSAPRRSHRLNGGPRRAIVWSTAAVLLLAALGWVLAHRSPPLPPPPAVATVPLPKPGAVLRDCAQCPEMTVMPAGRFKQGAAAGPAYEQPLHWVAIGRPFALSTNPVTREEFAQFVAATGRDMQGCDTYDREWKHQRDGSWQQPGFPQTDTHPVTCVSWNDADAYAKWLSAKTGHRYRLPSASEWEYAARAGTGASQPWNADGRDACADANVADASAAHRYPGWAVFPCDDGYVYTAPVGSFKANAMGLNDMLGNVLQWTEDCWHENYAEAPVNGSARLDGDCSLRELRGGSWFSAPEYVRADYRDRFPADYRTSSVGIRLARDIGP